jgi:hypothetical protein
MTLLKLTSGSLNFLEAATCLALGYRLLAIGYYYRVTPPPCVLSVPKTS